MKVDLPLYAGVHGCELCPLAGLHGWRRGEPQFRDDGERVGMAVPAWPGPGYERGGLALMAEAPGWVENVRGLPLQGPAGQTLDKMLHAVPVNRNNLLLLNMVRHQPPNNRLRDYPEAVANCAQWTQAELLHYDPSVVVLMGATAIKEMFGADAKVGRTRGMFVAKGGRHKWGARVYMATYHPQAVGYQGGAGKELGLLVTGDLRSALDRWYDLRGSRRVI